jgi:YbgC/YbaW family acyl-CoA thioester hydrolase
MFSFTTPVRFSDVDHAGIVYYPQFFHMFHLAFEELWRARLGPHAYRDLLDRERVGFPAVHADCDFHAPLRFGDSAKIDVAIAKMGAKSITFRYVVSNAETGQLCAEGRIACAVVDLARFVAIPVPEHVVDLLRDLVEP